jgi:hypothetical protein
MVHTWFFVQLKPFFTNGIRKLMQWSSKYVEKLGNYVEKWQ